MAQQYHYFASSVGNWSSDPSLSKCLKKQIKADKHDGRLTIHMCYLWLVPLPADAQYKINFYRPEVEGVKYLGIYAHNAKGEAIAAEERAGEIRPGVHTEGESVA